MHTKYTGSQDDDDVSQGRKELEDANNAGRGGARAVLLQRSLRNQKVD
jgi:hypothetical protein